MLGNHKVVLNSFCEIYDLLKPYADEEFWDLAENKIVPGAIYLIGRQQFEEHKHLIQQLLSARTISAAILCNPAEGSQIINRMYSLYGIKDMISAGHIVGIISGGYLPTDISYMYHEYFLTLIHNFTENLEAITEYQEKKSTDRPYKFLFLNGRFRAHRKYLLDSFKHSGLIDQSLWTNLDDVVGNTELLDIKLTENPIQYLPPKYEVDRYQDRAVAVPPKDHADTFYAKNHLFKKEWGEIYLAPLPYLDTYFSLVTETVFTYPHSFRTEKIWKPIAMGHPFVVAANSGYYRDLHNLGFQTFGHLIDESFDQIEDNQHRLERIAQVVEDLCRQDLPAFITAAEETCKYNQQLMTELRPRILQEFPQRFEQYIHERFNLNHVR